MPAECDDEMTTPTLKALYINPAGGCNLRCRHCWVNEGSSFTDTLTLSQWTELLGQARDIGCSYVKFTGGEPLMYKQIAELYRFAALNFPRVSIETNGTLEPAGLLDRFTEKRPYSVSVSLDSAYPEVHDSFRGAAGAWKSSVSFVSKLIGIGVNTQLIMSISDTDRKAVADMISLSRDLHASSLKINLIMPSGRGQNNSFTGNTNARDSMDFFNWIFTETPEWVLPTVPAALLPVNRLKYTGYCPVRNLMGVLPDGTFSLCGVAFSRKEMAWGRFPDMSVEKAWKNSPVYGNIRGSVPSGLTGVCSICIHRDSCIGNCVVSNLETGGSICSPDFMCQRAYEEGLFPPTRLVPGG